jgi:hypothetical protein
MAMAELSSWERKALAALRAYDAAVDRAAAARRSGPPGPPVDLDRAALDDRVRAHMAVHPGVSYADALEAVTYTRHEQPESREPLEVHAEHEALHRRVMAFAADHRLPYAEALERVLSEPWQATR